MSWGMICGWREDFNEGPYEYLAVRDGWQIFQGRPREEFSCTSPKGNVRLFKTEKDAKAHVYENGCSKPEETEI